MPSGRSVEDEVLTAVVRVHSTSTRWEAGLLWQELTGMTGTKVHLVTVQRALRRFTARGWLVVSTVRDGSPGRPRQVYELTREGLVAAQQAAARLVGRGSKWALEPLGWTFSPEGSVARGHEAGAGEER